MERGAAVLPSTEIWRGLSWSENKAQHEKEFNPAGKTARKRDAPTSTEMLLSLKFDVAFRCSCMLFWGFFG